MAIVILAAGEGHRFGSSKQVAKFKGKPLLQHQIDSCCNTKLDCFVVLGAHHRLIQNTVCFQGSTVLINTQWKKGMSSSIRHAVIELSNSYSGLLFVAGDQPLISSWHLVEMFKLWYKNPNCIVCSEFNGELGIPAIYSREFYSELKQLSGDKGGKKVILDNMELVTKYSLPEAAIDIDTPEDLASL